MRDGGKGDKRRPLVIDEEQFNNNWDAIFNKPKEEPEKILGIPVEDLDIDWDNLFNTEKK